MIIAARKLANASPGKPRQAELRRAISTAYYALFHAISKDAADLLVGVGPNRPDDAWTQIYRALQHGEARSACEGVRKLGFPPAIIACADVFAALQQQRHDADYKPNVRVRRAEALDAINAAEKAMASLKSASRKDRIAFVVQLLHRRRRP